MLPPLCLRKGGREEIQTVSRPDRPDLYTVYRHDGAVISVDGYVIDDLQRSVTFGEQKIELTTKEFDLLMLFVNNRGVAYSRETILERVWDENYFGSDRVVDDTLRRLRKKMPQLSIHTIYGFGYRLG